MSMNLECNLIEMIQTPTHITRMCMIDDKGVLQTSYKGKSALAPLLRYAEWEKSYWQKMINSVTTIDIDRTHYLNQIIRLDNQIKDIKENKLKQLEVWIS